MSVGHDFARDFSLSKRSATCGAESVTMSRTRWQMTRRYLFVYRQCLGFKSDMMDIFYIEIMLGCQSLET